jgi:hypothetical protein
VLDPPVTEHSAAVESHDRPVFAGAGESSGSPLVHKHPASPTSTADRHAASTRTTGHPAPAQREPVLPPIQPAGAPVSSAHGPAFTGGPGGTDSVLDHRVGAALDNAGAPTPARPRAVAGQQPGTSPD